MRFSLPESACPLRCTTHCRLLFKRAHIQADEVLLARDPVHASLTYEQAVHDFLRYPIQDDLNLVLEASARIALVDRGHFGRYVDRHSLADAGVLEQVSVQQGGRLWGCFVEDCGRP